MAGIVADHQALRRRHAELGGEVEEVARRRFAKPAVFQGGDEFEIEVAEAAPIQPGIDHRAGKDRVGGDDHRQISFETGLHKGPGLGHGADQRGQLRQSVLAERGETLPVQLGANAQVTLESAEKTLLVAAAAIFDVDQGMHSLQGDPGELMQRNAIEEVPAQPGDVGGDEAGHLHVDEGAVEVEKHGAYGGGVEFARHDRFTAPISE